jgi:ketosteroid isomerase-like protein
VSAENVEASRRLWEKFVAGDIAGVLERLDEEIVVTEPPELPGATVYHGHEGWQQQLAKFREVIGGLKYSVVEHIEYGDNVVTVIEASGAGAFSGISGTFTYAEVETWLDGKVVSMRYFMSKEAAVQGAEST